jgi:hypothetical protein
MKEQIRKYLNYQRNKLSRHKLYGKFQSNQALTGI